MKKRITIVFLIISGLLFCGVSYAQNTFNLKGKVLNEEKAAVDYFHVTLSLLGDSLIQTAGTFSNGEFEFNSLKHRTYDLTISSLGYVTVKRPVEIIDNTLDVGDVILQHDAHTIAEIVVTGSRPLIKQEKGKTTVNVSGTILSDAGSLMDVLKRSPGVIIDNGTLKVFGKGVPIVYIDNREITSSAELESLTSTDIDKIEIDRNPLAQYSASGNAVIKITTKRAKRDNLSVSLNNDLIQGRRTSYQTGVQLNFKKGNWTNLLSYSYSATKELDDSESYETNTLTDYVINNRGENTSDNSQNSHRVFSANEYSFAKLHRIGLQFSGVFNDTQRDEANNQTISKSNGYELQKVIKQNTDIFGDLYNTNISYQLNPDSTYNSLSFILGYAYKKTISDNSIDESILESANKTFSQINNKSDYGIWSATLNYVFKLSKVADFTIGAKYSDVVNNGQSIHINKESGQTLYDQKNYINDRIVAGFIEAKKSWGNFSITPGIRYEHTSSLVDVTTSRIDTTYHNLFPSISLEYSINENLSMSLAYAKKIHRPGFNQINPDKIYFDSLSYGVGNPALRPTINDNIELNIDYRDINFNLGFGVVKNSIVYTAVNDSDNPDISRWSYFNMPLTKTLSFGLNYSKRIKFYTVNASLMFNKQFINVPFLGSNIELNQPAYYASLSNTFNITNNLTFGLDYSYDSGGQDVIMTYKWSGNLSASLSWKLFENRLNLSINADDILYTNNANTWEDKYLNIVSGMKSRLDTRYIRIGVRYNFNSKATRNIKSKTSNEDELRRIY